MRANLLRHGVRLGAPALVGEERALTSPRLDVAPLPRQAVDGMGRGDRRQAFAALLELAEVARRKAHPVVAACAFADGVGIAHHEQEPVHCWNVALRGQSEAWEYVSGPIRVVYD